MSKSRRGHKSNQKPTKRNSGKKPQAAPPLSLLGGLGSGTKTNVKPSGRKKPPLSVRHPIGPVNKDLAEREIARAKGGGNQARLLTSHDPKVIAQELAMTEMAVARGWNVKQKDMIRNRLLKIMRKEEAEVFTKQGMVMSESAADELALKAAKVLEAMDSADVKRLEAFKSLNEPVQEGNKTQVNVNVNGNATITTDADNRRVELAKLFDKYGARPEVEEVETVDSKDVVEAVADVPRDVERW